MKLYPLFFFMTALTVLTPGPGVLMTLTNSLRYGKKETFGGILGISFGAMMVAAISATGLGVVLAASVLAFTTLKVIGALYLVYLGIRLWRAPAFRFDQQPPHEAGVSRRFVEGLSLQLTNPKVGFFFLAVFPQFIDHSRDFSTQFTVQVLTYSSLVVVIHCLYALSVQKVRRWLTPEKGGRLINKLGGATFVCFGAALAATKR